MAPEVKKKEKEKRRKKKKKGDNGQLFSGTLAATMTSLSPPSIPPPLPPSPNPILPPTTPPWMTGGSATMSERMRQGRLKGGRCSVPRTLSCSTPGPGDNVLGFWVVGGLFFGNGLQWWGWGVGGRGSREGGSLFSRGDLGGSLRELGGG